MREHLSVQSILVVMVVALAAGAARAGEPTIDFNRDIRPILSDNCYYCHGHDKTARKGDPPLRLDTKEGLFGNRDGAFPVVPGKPDDSVLYQRITSDDPEYIMPHKKRGKH